MWQNNPSKHQEPGQHHLEAFLQRPWTVRKDSQHFSCFPSRHKSQKPLELCLLFHSRIYMKKLTNRGLCNSDG